MKNLLRAFQGRRFLDTIGLLALLLPFGLNAFHFTIYLYSPFYREMFLCYRQVRLKRWQDKSLPLFLMFCIGFTLFYSVFGYPREDANQAVAVYIGLALWFGALRTGLLSDPLKQLWPAGGSAPSVRPSFMYSPSE